MSYPYPPQPADSGRLLRPATVTFSSLLLFSVAGLQLIGLIVGISIAGKIGDALKPLYANVEGGEAVSTFASIGTVIGLAIGLLGAITLAILAIFNNKGKNGSRITTWILGGISACCCAGGVVSNAASGGMNFGSKPQVGPSQDEVKAAIEAHLPSWYTPVNYTLTGLALIALVTALVLLALPPSNLFFKGAAAQPAFVPPPGYPQSGQPGTPGYPQHGAPGHLPAPGYPQSPGYPQPGMPDSPQQGGQPGYPAPGAPGQQPGDPGVNPGPQA